MGDPYIIKDYKMICYEVGQLLTLGAIVTLTREEVKKYTTGYFTGYDGHIIPIVTIPTEIKDNSIESRKRKDYGPDIPDMPDFNNNFC